MERSRIVDQNGEVKRLLYNGDFLTLVKERPHIDSRYFYLVRVRQNGLITKWKLYAAADVDDVFLDDEEYDAGPPWIYVAQTTVELHGQFQEYPPTSPNFWGREDLGSILNPLAQLITEINNN